MTTVTTPVVTPQQRLVLDNVNWTTYSRFLRIFEDRPAFRLAYDRGVLEIMSPSPEHESDADLLGRLVVVLTEELGLTIKSGRCSTYRRRRRRRGIEPDLSWWIAHEPQVRGRRAIDLRTDPPPDLTIEVDITGSSIDRMGIYASLGVPEVWRFENEVLSFHLLGTGGSYTSSSHSLSFPFVTPADLTQFLAMRGPQLDENGIVRLFRDWVRQHHPSGGTP